MKKKIVMLLVVTTMLGVCACGNKKDTVETPQGTEASNAAAEVSGEEVQTAYGTVTLGAYKGLTTTLTKYEFTDEDIDEEIQNQLYSYLEYKEVDRPSQDGDYVYAYIVGKDADGQELVAYGEGNTENEGEPYEVYIGYEEFGVDFDSKLTGVSAGDELSFEIAYPEDYDTAEMAGKTISYEVEVVRIEEEVLPELTDDFVKETMGYNSMDELREATKASMAENYNADGISEAKEDLIGQVIASSNFSSYDEETYQANLASVKESYESYVEWLGYESLEELLQSFEMTEEDLNTEALEQTYRIILVDAISSAEGLDLSEDEYNTGVAYYAQSYGYATNDDLLKDYDAATLEYWILEDKVLDFLYANATVEEVVGSLEDAQLEGVEE